MRPDKFTEAKKQYLAAQSRLDELEPYKYRGGHYRFGSLAQRSKHILWVPLDKPQFIGWNIWVALSESGLRRRDAVKLLTVLNLLKVGKENPNFIRDSAIVRVIRTSDHKYITIQRKWRYRKNSHTSYTHTVDVLFNRTISDSVYDRLSDDLKGYFSKTRIKDYWGNREQYEYTLDWNFPTYELEVKVEKAYNRFIGHLYGDQIGEYDKLSRWLWHEAQAPIRTSLGHDSGRWRDKTGRGISCRWKSALSEVTMVALTDPEYIEHIEDIEYKYGLYSKKLYGYS